jgi:hypothetical protein
LESIPGLLKSLKTPSPDANMIEDWKLQERQNNIKGIIVEGLRENAKGHLFQPYSFESIVQKDVHFIFEYVPPSSEFSVNT